MILTISLKQKEMGCFCSLLGKEHKKGGAGRAFSRKPYLQLAGYSVFREMFWRYDLAEMCSFSVETALALSLQKILW